MDAALLIPVGAGILGTLAYVGLIWCFDYTFHKANQRTGRNDLETMWFFKH